MKNLRKAYRKARKGKGAKWYVREFDTNLEKNLLQLQKELLNMTYEPKPLKQFTIRDPKTRVISASNFRDRVVHHALCNIIEPIFEKTFICDSYANRKDKGAHAAMKRFDYFKRKVSHNGRLLPNAIDGNQVYGYVLKADIKRYFDSVNHKIMIRIISRKIKDEKILWLIRKILNNHNCKISGKGMPIGNLTSQFFANVYLNELDYFVKHKMKSKYYIRYVDDFVTLHKDKEFLEKCKIQMDEFLLNCLGLELHKQKSKIRPLSNGTNFLGFRVFYYHKLLKKSNIKLVKNRLHELRAMHKEGQITKEELNRRMDGWFAYAIHGNTYKLRRNLSKR